MLTEDICKALYALPGGVVKPRRRTLYHVHVSKRYRVKASRN